MKVDEVKVEIGGDVLTVTPLTIAEVAAWNLVPANGIPCDERLDGFIRTHVKKPDGSQPDLGALSIRQLRKLVDALVGIPADSPMAECVGMLIGEEE